MSPVGASAATAPEVQRDYADAMANGAVNGAYGYQPGESPPAYWPPVANGYQNGPPPPPLPAGAHSIAAPLADLAGILAGAGASSGIGVTAPGAPGAGLQPPADPVPPALRPADPLSGGYPNGVGHDQRGWNPQDPSTTRPDQPARQQPADLSSLPPAIAASLARLSRTARPPGGGEGG
jgi:hypothetical protein